MRQRQEIQALLRFVELALLKRIALEISFAEDSRATRSLPASPYSIATGVRNF